MVEVGDNPGVDEGEPEALITSLHHAREPASLTTVLYFLWYVLENYESNREINTLLNNRRLFVVPILLITGVLNLADLLGFNLIGQSTLILFFCMAAYGTLGAVDESVPTTTTKTISRNRR